MPSTAMLGFAGTAVDFAPAPLPGGCARLPQTTEDLDAFIASNGIEAALVKEEEKASSPEPAVIKSLVFMADAQPLLVVVLGSDKVEARKVADVLGLARRRVRLATPEEALQATGYEIGTIPPFGHIVKLHTLLDAAVTQQSMVYGGGGHPDVEVMVAVPELLHFIQPEVADVAVRPAGPDPFPPAAAAAAAAAPGLDLPLPWAPGSKAVRMVVLVTKTRRVARRLMFVNVVPESVHELPEKVQASYLRRLWKSPLDLAGPPVEVQLIMGSTIERTLGQQRCEELLSSIKLGSVIFISGVVQDRPQKAARPQDALDSQAAKSEARSASRGRVLDVVCHRVSRVFPDKRALQQTLDQVRRQAGNDWVVSAADLELLRWKQQQEQQQQGELLQQGQDLDPQQQPGVKEAPDAAAAPSSLQGTRSRSRGRPSSRQRGPASAAAAAALETWQLPLPTSSVLLVDSLQGLQAARQAVFGRGGAAPGAVVVGIDCEWRPEERRSPRHPVALMQVALRDRVLLLDLLTLCNAGQTEVPRTPTDCMQLSELQREAGQFIKELLTAGQVLKLGFSLASDLDRLTESYPWVLSLPSDAAPDRGECSLQGVGLQQQPADAEQQACAATSASQAQQRARDATVAKLAAVGTRVRSAVGCLDLGLLARKATSSSSSSSRCTLPPVAASSLSRLAEAVLGLPLDKTQQRSDWSQRPLTQEQLSYAAMDAHVLIAILDRVLEHGHEASQATGMPMNLQPADVIMAGHATALFTALSSDLA